MEIYKEFIRNPAELEITQLLPDRPTLGNDVPVILWRLIRIVGFHQILGEETATTVYHIGKQIGKMLKVKTVDELLKELTNLKIGKLTFPVNTKDALHMAIGECITCAGIRPPLGKPICQLEVGIVAGALEAIYPGTKVIGEETKCIGGLGDPVCLVECRII